MNRLIVAVAVAATSACSLYFEDEPDMVTDPVPDPWPLPPDAQPWPIDAPTPDAADTACRVVAYCGGDGTLYQTPCLPNGPDGVPDNFDTLGSAFATCPSGACQDDSGLTACPGGNCAAAEAALCRPPSACQRIDGQPCTDEGAVTRCTEPVGCAVSVAADQCTCVDGSFACEPVCVDGLCGAPALETAVSGLWVGTVTPPSFSAPYTGTLAFNTDRTYAADRSSQGALFFYGVDGSGVRRRWRPIGASPTGGVATVDVQWDTGNIRTALITDIVRDGSSLRFTFWDSWLSCSRPFRFEMTAAQ